MDVCMNKTKVTKDNHLKQELDKVRNQIVDLSLVVACFLAGATYILSLLSINRVGFQLSFITDFIAVAMIIAVTLFRKRIPLKYKALIILVGLFLTIFVDLLQYGLLSANKVIIVLIPFFSLIVFPVKRVYLVYGLAILGFISVGFLVVTGNNPMLIGGSPNLDKVLSWAINLFLLLIVSVLITIAFIKFNQTYSRFLVDLEARNLVITNSEQNYREIFNSSANAIFIHNLSGEIVDVNQTMLDMYGYTKSEALNLTIGEISSNTAGYSTERAEKYIKDAIKGEELNFDWWAKKKSGELFWVEVSLKRTYILGDERILAVVSDIDERKRAEIKIEKYQNQLEELVRDRTRELQYVNEELKNSNTRLKEQKEELTTTFEKLQSTQEQLIQVEKMASLGLLSAGVAHEINNPLNFIQGGVSGLEEFFEENTHCTSEDTNTLINAIKEGVERASKIVTSLNHFSHQGESLNEDCDVHDILENCLVILKNKLRDNIEVNRNFTADSTKIAGNEGKLHQAFLNILTNSIQAIDGKGTIDLSTFLNSNILRIMIKDSGCGMSNEILRKITEPFFTTKDPGAGTGLGLSITFNIIKEHKGTLDFDSEIDKGTSVFISLPAN